MKAKAADIRIVGKRKVVCDGDSGSVKGHPRVFLNIGDEDKIICPYCERIFVYDPKIKEEDHH
jgi:uncharacterized Zn-finger protein